MWAVADVTPCELGPPFWIDDQRFSPHSSLDFQLFISIAQNPAGDSPLTISFFILVILLPLPLHIPSLPTFHLFSQFLKLFRLPPCLVPSHSLYVSFYLHFFNAHFLFLSLYLSFCLPLWEFKKILCLSHERKVLLHSSSSLLLWNKRQCEISPRHTHTLTFIVSLLSYSHSLAWRLKQCSSAKGQKTQQEAKSETAN